jgi:hypothetical protein
MVIKTQRELSALLIKPVSLLPERILVEFESPDFKGTKHYQPVAEGYAGEYVLTA